MTARWAWLGSAVAANRSRLALAGCVGAYFVLLEALGGHQRWARLGVSPLPVSFGDLRNVTSAWDCTRRGIAVLPTNPCDWDNRPANYPRMWLLPWHLGLGEKDTFVLGLVVAAVFLLAAVVVLPGRASWPSTAAYAFFLCSPAAMLGVERGNVDLLIFGLVVVAVLELRRGVPGLVLGDLGLLLAACSKLFPVFALGVLVRLGRSRAVLSLALVGVALGMYAGATWGVLREIQAALPQEDIYSYGVRRFSQWLGAGLDGASAPRSWLPWWDVLLGVVTIAGGALVGRRLRSAPRVSDLQTAERRDLDLYWAGAGVYLGTYLLARNYDYRLVFCLLTVPQLCRWAHRGLGFAWVSLGALAMTMWLDGLFSWFLRSWLNDWNSFTAVGAAGQPLPLAVIGQFVLSFTFVCGIAASAPLPEWLGRRSVVPVVEPAQVG